MLANTARKKKIRSTLRLMRRNWTLYLLLLPAALYIFMFCYRPMYGVQIAFKNFTIAKGVTGSPWVGLKWFKFFFHSPNFTTVLWNTVILSLYGLVAGFPVPILLALMLHNVPSNGFKRVTQTVAYLPHFISTVVVVTMLSCFTSVNSGFINTIIKALGGEPVFFMGKPQYFRHLFVWSDIWQGMGWSSIIYLAALTGISSELHEAAMIDGATKLQRIIHIDLPGIMPTMVILLIMSCGGTMSVGFEKVFLMQNGLNMDVSEVISTYTYKQGLINSKFSYSAAIGLFNNAINMLFLTLVNAVSKRLAGSSLW